MDNSPVAPVVGTLVPGIGDEVVAGITCLLGTVLVIGIAYIVLKQTQQNSIHPGQTNSVRDAREALDVREASERDGDPGNCPVCLGPPVHLIEATCGHTYCAQCFLTYWRHDRWPNAARCPVCRREVTLVLMSASARTGDLQQELRDYNLRMSGECRPLMHYLYDLPVLLRHLAQDLFTAGGLRTVHRLHLLLLILLTCAYLLAPLDLIPEAVFGLLGLLDDLAVLLLMLLFSHRCEGLVSPALERITS
ncbi:hypothetical protein EMCRGX_G018894 [Ephydatia muelleri]